MSDYKTEQSAAEFWREVERRIARQIDTRFREQTGIVPGVAYGSIKFDAAGRAVWGSIAGTGTVISSGARVGASGNTTVASGATNVAAVFASGDVEYDDAGYWDSGQPTRLTAPADGHYFISAYGTLQLGGATAAGLVISCHTDTSGDAGLIGRVGDNCSFGVAGAGYDAGYGPSYLELNCAGIVTMAAGQYVEILGRNDDISGAPDANLYACILTIAKL